MYQNNLLLAFQNVHMVSDFSFSSIFYSYLCFRFQIFCFNQCRVEKSLCLSNPPDTHTHTHSQLLCAGRDHSVFTGCCWLAKWDQLGVKCILMWADRGRLSKNIIPHTPFKKKKHVLLLISSCCTINVFQRNNTRLWSDSPIYCARPDKINYFMDVQLLNWLNCTAPYFGSTFSIPLYKPHQTPECRVWWAEGWCWSPVLQESFSSSSLPWVLPLTSSIVEVAERPDHTIWSLHHVKLWLFYLPDLLLYWCSIYWRPCENQIPAGMGS